VVKNRSRFATVTLGVKSRRTKLTEGDARPALTPRAHRSKRSLANSPLRESSARLSIDLVTGQLNKPN